MQWISDEMVTEDSGQIQFASSSLTLLDFKIPEEDAVSVC